MSQAAPYLHGYQAAEQRRLLDQAAHWKDRLILKGTHYPPGTRLLELGCGVGAVLGVLGGAFPGLRLLGVDREARQVAAARRHLGGLGLEARLLRADALGLPLAADSVDAAWMMWFLEHVGDPIAALAEARRVLKPGGSLTAIEVDYRVLRWAEAPRWNALLEAFCAGMDRHGRSDAGSQLGRWLSAAGFARCEDRALPQRLRGAAAATEMDYLLGFIEPSLADLAGLPGASSLASLRAGAQEGRRLARRPGARLDFTVHKAVAWA